MVYKRSMKGKRGMKKRTTKKSSALTVAQRALRMVKSVRNENSQTKYFGRSLDQDVAGDQTIIIPLNAVDASWTKLFEDPTGGMQTGYLTGQKAFCKYVKGFWEVHCDNLNNEEETTNHTISIISFKKPFDRAVGAGSIAGALADHTYSANGMVFYNPVMIKTHYKRHFVITQGGTSPGTAGETAYNGRFYIPVKKLMRLARQSSNEYSVPASYQDILYLVWHTDNTSADTENPRMNGTVIQAWRDNDTQYGY